MDYFKKNKILFWCIAILIVLNVVTLGSFWLRRPPHRPIGAGQSPDGQKIMEERLQLSDEQARQFERIRNEHFMRARPLQDDIHKIRLDLLDEVFSSEPNEVKIQKLLAEVGDKQGEFEKNLYNHFQELKNVCNQQQREELKLMLIDLIERTRPQDPRRRDRGASGGFRPGQMPPARRQ